MKCGILITAYISGLFLTVTGALFKIMHRAGADAYLLAGLVFSLFFLVIVLMEIFRSHKINRTEKLIWVICLLWFLAVTGLVYLVSGRKRIRNTDNEG
jgi:uncharacterized membrane protein YhaH (DUF805 family)